MTSTSLTLRPPAPPAPLTGRPGRWARDFALVGGLQMATILWMSSIPIVSVEAAAFWGTAAALGAVLGGVLAPLLERSRGVLPLRAVAPLALGLAAAWGAGSLAIANGLLGLGNSLGHTLSLGSLLGGMVFGWFWLAYTVASVMRLPRWPVLLATVPCTVVGWALLTWVVF